MSEGIAPDSDTDEQGLGQPDRPPRRFRRAYEEDPYTLSQLYHFALCPYRYKLERLDARARAYTSRFQLRFLARGLWLHQAFAAWAADGDIAAGADAIRDRVLDLVRVVEGDVRTVFPAFSESDWHEVRDGVERTAAFWARAHVQDDKPETLDDALVIGEAGPLSIPLAEGFQGQEVQVRLFHARHLDVIRNGRSYNNVKALPADAFQVDWLIHGTKPEDDAAREVQKLGLTLFAQQYVAAKEGWWDAAKTAFEHRHWGNWRPDWLDANMESVQDRVLQLVQQLETGAFPKNPGDHCRYCSAQRACLGVDVDRTA